ncbi:hypothetical protein LguiB_024566 [Lonicera macranthoides]
MNVILSSKSSKVLFEFYLVFGFHLGRGGRHFNKFVLFFDVLYPWSIRPKKRVSSRNEFLYHL